MVTKQQIRQMITEEWQKANSLGFDLYPVDPADTDFPNAISFAAQCTTRGANYGCRRIRVSIHVLNEEESVVRPLIMHEVLHCLKDGGHGHGAKWKAAAKVVNEKYGYHIKRCGRQDTEEEIHHDSLEKAYNDRCDKRWEKWEQQHKKASCSEKVVIKVPKHMVRCKSCGYEWKKSRETNITLHPERYHCRCGGRIERVY